MSIGVRIPAGRCAICGESFSPPRDFCPHCRSAEIERLEAGPFGSLYSFTTIHVGAGKDQPYTLGYVDLDEGPRLLVQIITESPDDLACDTRVVLVTSSTTGQGETKGLNTVRPYEQDAKHG